MVSASPRQPDLEVQQAASLLGSRYGIVVPPWRFPLLRSELERIGGGGASEGLGKLNRDDEEAWASVTSLAAVAESYLFRHPGHFGVLHDLGLELVRRGRPCQVLSAGCSTGEEVWSAAAVLAALPDPPIGQHKVTGWDLNERRLRHARAGSYNQWSCRRGFDHYGDVFQRHDGSWSVAPELRRLTRFERVNLVADEYPDERFDAILFRNVSIYWDPVTANQVTRRLLGMLADGGLLMVGPSDPVQLPAEEWRQRFEPGGGRVYERNGGQAPKAAKRTRQASPSPRAASRRTRGLSRSPGREWQPTSVGWARAEVSPEPAEAPAAPVLADGGDEALDEVRALADRGEYQSALELLSRSELTEPAEGSLWEGILLLNLGHMDRAVASLRKCVFFQSEEPLYRRWLAVAYDAVGRSSEAARELRNAAELEGG